MNKNTLNAQRLLQYFRKDWSENAAQLYYYFIIPYGIMTLLFIWMDFTKTHSVVVALEQVRQGMETDNNSYQLIMENALSGKDDCWFSIVFTAVLCFDFFMAFAGSTFFKTSKYRKDYIADLTFPVSNAEKFIVRWFRISIISFPIFCLATVLADFTRIGFIHFLYPEVSLSFPVPWLSSECDVYLPLAILQAYGLQALFILGGTYWQKKPFQKTLSLVLLTSLMYYFTFFCTVFYFIGPDFVYHNTAQQWVHGWTFGIPVFLILFGYLLTYLRMRRATLLPSWKDKTTLVVFAALLIGLGLCVWMPNFIVDHFAYG